MDKKTRSRRDVIVAIVENPEVLSVNASSTASFASLSRATVDRRFKEIRDRLSVRYRMTEDEQVLFERVYFKIKLFKNHFDDLDALRRQLFDSGHIFEAIYIEGSGYDLLAKGVFPDHPSKEEFHRTLKNFPNVERADADMRIVGEFYTTKTEISLIDEST